VLGAWCYPETKREERVCSWFVVPCASLLALAKHNARATRNCFVSGPIRAHPRWRLRPHAQTRRTGREMRCEGMAER